jgi:hypothetical protein
MESGNKSRRTTRYPEFSTGKRLMKKLNYILFLRFSQRISQSSCLKNKAVKTVKPIFSKSRIGWFKPT